MSESQVWLHAEYAEGIMRFIYTADSDAIMTKGIVAILINVLSRGKNPSEIMQLQN